MIPVAFPSFGPVNRSEFLGLLADRVVSLPDAHPMRVAIDGVDGAGKTTLADALVPLVRSRGRPVVRVSIDDFHHVRARRHARGPESPDGYYRDNFDYEAFRERVLDPTSASGSRLLQSASHDLASDRGVDPEPVAVGERGIVLVDGIFLHRPELLDHWNFSVFLRAAFDVTVARAVARDGGDAAAVRARYDGRYVPGQRLYLREADPETHADWVVDYDDPRAPAIFRAL